MTDENAFLQAVIADPDDDAPRLIYADWLDENGESERAEFIRVQCHLARMGNDDQRRAELVSRERELLAAHDALWTTNTLRIVAREWTYHRGFIRRVGCNAIDFLERGDSLFALAPVQELRLYGSRDEMLTLVHCPHLGRFQSLDLSYNFIRDLGVQFLSNCAALSRLAELNLSHNRIRKAALATCSDHPTLAISNFSTFGLTNSTPTTNEP